MNNIIYSKTTDEVKKSPEVEFSSLVSKGLEVLYKGAMSERIKRGIRQAKLHKQ